MNHLCEMITNSRRAYEAMTDEDILQAMDDHMHLRIDPVEEGIVEEDGTLSDREQAINHLLWADERELRLLGHY